MSISEFEQVRIRKVLSNYCQEKHRHTARLRFQIGHDRVKLYWSYPHPLLSGQFVTKNYALLAKEAPQGWTLYCSDPAGHWYMYQPPTRSLNIDQLLKVIDENQNNCFFPPKKLD